MEHRLSPGNKLWKLEVAQIPDKKDQAGQNQIFDNVNRFTICIPLDICVLNNNNKGESGGKIKYPHCTIVSATRLKMMYVFMAIYGAVPKQKSLQFVTYPPFTPFTGKFTLYSTGDYR